MLNYGEKKACGGSSNIVPVREVEADPPLNYPRMNVVPIRLFSSACVVLGIQSILFQVTTLLINVTLLRPHINFAADLSGHGIWGGVFYLTAGSLGLVASSKRTRCLLAGTVTISAISIALSAFATLISGIAAGAGFKEHIFYSDPQPVYACYLQYGLLCDVWECLEWLLFVSHFVAFFSSITLTVLASKALCTCTSYAETNDTTRSSHNVAVKMNGHTEALGYNKSSTTVRQSFTNLQ